MSLLRLSNSTLTVVVLLGLIGCATPPVIPPAPTPADLIKAIPQGNNTTVVNVASPQHQTLPDFLGVTRACYGAIYCCNTIRTEAAYCFPGLAGVSEPGAGVLSPTDAAGAPQGGPVATAAAIKAKEDEAKAKIAALRYLATIGCGACGHPPYTEVEAAFIAGLEDCTEEVRYEAVMAIIKTTCGDGKHCKCTACGGKACCSEKIQKKLREMAYETNDNGCPMEPSERVRRKARLALRNCGPAIIEPTEPEEPTPVDAPPTKVEGQTAAPTAGATPAAAGTAPATSPATPPADTPAAPAQPAPLPPQNGALPPPSQPM